MNEEQDILDFFSRRENLPLGLSVSEQMDEIRKQMNNRLWRDLLARIDTLVKSHALGWQVSLTEDRNAPDSLVGLHCSPGAAQRLYLSPMMEQQYLGDMWRIYFGVMWSEVPTDIQLGFPAVTRLKASLQIAGFKNNASFLGWQWTAFHPRRKEFLLRYALQPEKLLDEVATILIALLTKHHAAIKEANAALDAAFPSLAESLDQLRGELLD